MLVKMLRSCFSSANLCGAHTFLIILSRCSHSK
jgi:hypothetical protein